MHSIQQLKVTRLWSSLCLNDDDVSIAMIDIDSGLNDPPDCVLTSWSVPPQMVVDNIMC